MKISTMKRRMKRRKILRSKRLKQRNEGLLSTINLINEQHHFLNQAVENIYRLFHDINEVQKYKQFNAASIFEMLQHNVAAKKMHEDNIISLSKTLFELSEHLVK